MKRTTIVDNIASIIGNQPLALAIHNSVSSAIRCPFIHQIEDETALGYLQPIT
ncbi:MAG: hypothetical protein K9H64_10760 [Bacteroidales bacterium]|nr:hypothetical protein [Bacteroidales bacterium]MCF8456421.1 hypothetical protein [Bacteroidales bacterium]